MNAGSHPICSRPRASARAALSACLLLAALGLAGCESNVKLNEVEVEDRAATAVAPGTGGAAAVVPRATPAGGNTVAPVDIGKAAAGQDAAGPGGAARIVYFDYDSFTLRAEAAPLIDAHARFLKAGGNRRIVIEGHTDERGGREYNLALGQRRAEAVRRALALLGVTDGQMEAVSLGEEKLADTGRDEAAHSRNRRAEIVYR